MSSIYQSWIEIQETIKSSIFYIGLSYVFGNMFYHISLGLNKVFRYLLKSIGFELKFVKYPKQKKDEDILGI